jgi:aspartyl-tRNA(Asn)/glutamyl-tRNA(Gln) amidotransferase subunit C
MSLEPNTLARLATLARLDIATPTLSPTDNDSVSAASLAREMSSILGLIALLQAVDTKGVAPMNHPLSVITDLTAPRRADIAATDIDRSANQANAPQTENGLFLVPKVLE